MHNNSDVASNLQPGLPDRYELRRHIADGGMASVWCADDRTLGRPVAIKVLAAGFAHDDRAVRRFKREARTAARLSAHPHVVKIYDVGESDDGPYIVMEYLAGGTVADALRVGEVSREDALRWLRESASALDYAHGRGVVHRDIKPGNLLLSRERTVYVADFGIAHFGTEDTLTSTGQLLGTAAYLSPEQALGRAATEASDRYAFAVAAFELLTGERPFKADTFAEQAREHVGAPRPRASRRNPDLPRAVDAVLSRGLAKQPEDRWSTATEFTNALGEALSVTRPAGVRTKALAAISPAAVATRMHTAAATRRERRASRAADLAERPGPSRGLPGALPAPGAATEAREGQPIFASVSAPARRPARAAALAALAAASVAIGLVAGAGNDTSGTHAKVSAGLEQTNRPIPAIPTPPPAHRAKPHPKPPPPAPTSTAVAEVAPTAVELEARGHQLMEDGAYSAAIPVLRQAVDAAPPTDITYAYALYDLGRSLRLAGDPQAAIPILERRLQIPNQTAVVQTELELAQQAAGQSETSGGSSPAGAGAKTGGGGPGATHTKSGPTPPSDGGAGLAPGAPQGGSGPQHQPEQGAPGHGHGRPQGARRDRHGGVASAAVV
jgi:serine/threonine-protein kinase